MKNAHKKIKQKMSRGNRALAVFVFAAIVFSAVFIGLGSAEAEARAIVEAGAPQRRGQQHPLRAAVVGHEDPRRPVRRVFAVV